MDKPLDRKGRRIELNDIVAFDIPVFYGTEDTKVKMWDIFWGKSCEKGIMVDFCPITQKNNVLYKYPEDNSELLIIRKHVEGAAFAQDQDIADDEAEAVITRKSEEEVLDQLNKSGE